MSVRLRNDGERVFVDRFAGETYRIEPGEVAVVPDAAAKLWLGDWTLPEPQRKEDIRRAAFRRADGLPRLTRVDGEPSAPPKPQVVAAPPPAPEPEEAAGEEPGESADEGEAAPEDARSADQVCPVCGKVVGSPVGLRSHLAAHQRRGEGAGP